MKEITYDIITGKGEKRLKTYKKPMIFEYDANDFIRTIIEMDKEDIKYIKDKLDQILK